MGSYEWIILEVGFLGLLVWELVRVRRSIRLARDADKAEAGRAEAGQPERRRPAPIT